MNSSDFQRLTLDLRERNAATKVIETFVAVLIVAAAFFGNVLVCWTIYRNRMLRKVPNYYICALALSDLLFACFAFSFVVGVSATGKWPFSDLSCQFQGYMAMWMAYASILTITLTALNRFFKVIKPNRYPKYYTPKRTIASLVAVWIFAACGALPHLLRKGNKYIFHPGKMVCLFDLDKASIIYSIIVTLIYFGAPTVIIVMSYWKIFQFARRQNNIFAKRQATPGGSTLNRSEINITRTLFAILVAFCACYIQIAVIDMIETVHKQFSLPRQVYVLYTIMAGLASCLNPVIYGVLNPTFRKEYVKIFCLRQLGFKINTISTESETEHSLDAPNARKIKMKNGDRSVSPHENRQRGETFFTAMMNRIRCTSSEDERTEKAGETPVDQGTLNEGTFKVINEHDNRNNTII